MVTEFHKKLYMQQLSFLQKAILKQTLSLLMQNIQIGFFATLSSEHFVLL